MPVEFGVKVIETTPFANFFFLLVSFLRLQMRLNEMLKDNKDFKSNSSLMERKVDELTEENGVLSSQVPTHVQVSLLNVIML